MTAAAQLPWETEAQQLRILGLHRSRLRPGEIGVDLFAGGGGYSEGYQWAVGMPPAVAVNHDANAIAMHTLNHPESEHFLEDVFHVDPLLAVRGRLVGVLHGSPDCTHFSRAKGSVPKSKKIRGLAWAIVRWAAEVSPRILSLENVEEFITWGPLHDTHSGGCRGKVDESCPTYRKGCHFGTPIKARAGETFRAFVACLTTGLEAGHPAYEDMHFALVGDPPEPCKRHVLRRRRNCAACIAVATSDYPRMPLDRYAAIVAKCQAGLGYEIEWRTLRASYFGAPTSRKRLYVVGRRDGERPRWPLPTHGPKAYKPELTAADCINWADLGVSIFLTAEEARAYGVKRPLAEATQRRIAEGIRRFVLNNPKPFLVPYHSARRPDETPRVHDVGDPLATQTTENRFAVVTPTLMSNNTNNAPHSVEEPLGAITTGNRHFAVAPMLTPAHSHGWDRAGGPSWPVDQPVGTVVGKDGKALVAPQLLNVTHGGRIEPADEPFKTITAAHRGEKALIAPVLTRTAHGEEGPNGSKRWGKGAHEIDEPVPTVTGSNDFALVAPTLIQTSYGEREGQSPRVLDLHEPLGTVVAGGVKHGLVDTLLAREEDVAAFLVRNNTGMNARDLTEVMPTVCARETMSLGLAHLTKFNTGSVGQPIDQPVPTITAGDGSKRPAGAAHGLGVVTAHVVTHNGQSIGAAADAPVPTVTAGGMGHQGVIATHMLGVEPCPDDDGETRWHVPTGYCVNADGLREYVRLQEIEAAELAAAIHVTKFNGTSEAGAPIDEPLHTVTSGGNRGGGHHGVAAVHLAKYYGSDEHGQAADEPLHTIPTVDRFALVAAFLRKFDVIDDDRPYVTVTIEGETFILYDIAMRMLQPRELARAQGFPDTYQLIGTKSQQVARIGNSVCPHVAAAIVRANLDSEEEVWN
ncbi:MAG TPA: DNA cytosine methyltransferase [Gemmatimonadaceae bacterium]